MENAGPVTGPPLPLGGARRQARCRAAVRPLRRGKLTHEAARPVSRCGDHPDTVQDRQAGRRR
jgi:hypothetical protein